VDQLPHVEVDDGVEEFVVKRLDWPAGHHATGIVHQHVQLSECLHRAADQVFRRIGFGDVALEQERFAAGATNPVRDALRRFAAGVIVNRDFHASRTEGSGDCTADAGGSARDERDASFEILEHGRTLGQPCSRCQ
jgi:hypothetical protein